MNQTQKPTFGDIDQTKSLQIYGVGFVRSFPVQTEIFIFAPELAAEIFEFATIFRGAKQLEDWLVFVPSHDGQMLVAAKTPVELFNEIAGGLLKTGTPEVVETFRRAMAVWPVMNIEEVVFFWDKKPAISYN